MVDYKLCCKSNWESSTKVFHFWNDYIKYCKLSICVSMQKKTWMTFFLFKEFLSFSIRSIIGFIFQASTPRKNMLKTSRNYKSLVSFQQPIVLLCGNSYTIKWSLTLDDNPLRTRSFTFKSWTKQQILPITPIYVLNEPFPFKVPTTM